MYETILVAFDGSEYSKAGLLEAAHWMKRHGGNLYAIYVVHFYEEEFLIFPELREKRIKAALNKCTKEKEELKEKLGIEFQCIIKEGEPTEEIIEEAKTIGATLIVAGTYGKKGYLKRLVLGSVSTELCLNSPVDVLIVKKPCEACRGEYINLLIPFDNSDFSKTALRQAFRFYKEYQSAIKVIYVLPTRMELMDFYMTPHIKQKMQEEGEKILKEAQILAEKEGVPIEIILEEGLVADKIIEVAKNRECDLIIIGPYGWKKTIDRRLIGSITEKILHISEIPVLIVKEGGR
ncbi:MAG: universal stress protein [Caldimicrobium sp.]